MNKIKKFVDHNFLYGFFVLALFFAITGTVQVCMGKLEHPEAASPFWRAYGSVIAVFVYWVIAIGGGVGAWHCLRRDRRLRRMRTKESQQEN
jgi:hypothetical protein